MEEPKNFQLNRKISPGFVFAHPMVNNIFCSQFEKLLITLKFLGVEMEKMEIALEQLPKIYYHLPGGKSDW